MVITRQLYLDIPEIKKLVRRCLRGISMVDVAVVARVVVADPETDGVAIAVDEAVAVAWTVEVLLLVETVTATPAGTTTLAANSVPHQ